MPYEAQEAAQGVEGVCGARVWDEEGPARKGSKVDLLEVALQQGEPRDPESEGMGGL